MHFRLFLQYNKKTHYAQNNPGRKEKKNETISYKFKFIQYNE